MMSFFVYSGTVAVLSSGGIVTVGGANAVAQAAHCFSKPVIAVAPLFKLTYLPFFDHHSSNELLPPAAVRKNTPTNTRKPTDIYVAS